MKKSCSHFDFVKKNKIHLNSKRSQANIISIVLIILIVIILIVVIGNILFSFFKYSIKSANSEVFSTRLSVEKADFYVNGDVKVRVKKFGEEEITKLRFVFYDESGGAHILDETKNLPGIMETKNYYYNASEIFGDDEIKALKDVGVAPAFEDNLGNEFKSKESIHNVASEEGLVGWWKFEGDSRDFIGKNHGTLIDNAKIEKGVLVLDGDGDYVDCGDSLKLRLGKYQTISAWINILADSSDWVRFVGKGNLTYRNYGLWRAVDGDILFQIKGPEGYCSFYNNLGPGDSANIGVDSGWHHVVGVYDETYGRLYINGNLVHSQSCTATPYQSEAPLTIGYGTMHKYFNGLIDNVMIFNRALSEKEIKSIYENQKNSFYSL